MQNQNSEETFGLIFFAVGAAVAGVLLLYFFGASDRDAVYNPASPAPAIPATRPADGEDLRTYRGADFEFRYPSKLELTEQNGAVHLAHSTPFENTGPCDMMDEGRTYHTLQDFGMSLEYVSAPLAQVVKSRSPYMPDEYFSGQDLRVSPGFIDAFSAGSLEGYAIYEGPEGCGHMVYYFPRGERTLVVKHDLVQLLSGVISSNRAEEFKKVPGAILKEESEALRKNILESVRFRDSEAASAGTNVRK